MAKYLDLDGLSYLWAKITNKFTLTPGGGVSISNNIISNTGGHSIATGSTNGTISVNTNGSSAEVAIKGLGSVAYIDDAPKDGLQYVRKDGEWSEVESGGVEEAPKDGKKYFRELGKWVKYDNSMADVPAGVYICDINSRYWNVEDWDGSIEVDSIAVVSETHRFGISLEYSDNMISNGGDKDANINEVAITDSSEAALDFDGATKSVNGYITAAKSFANNYIFPSGVNGYLGAAGEYMMVANNLDAINDALTKVNGSTLRIDSDYYSYIPTSTYRGYLQYYYEYARWHVNLNLKEVRLFFNNGNFNETTYVRPLRKL